jgi:hypothetical protein
MEEGPEPQEWVERAAEEHHHAHGHGQSGSEAASEHRSTTLPAITAAVLAVLAALGSLLSGHAANQAILAMTRASDQWAYYQAKSTKGHLYEVGAEIVSALGQGQNPNPNPALEHFRTEAKRYEREKAEVQHEAEALEHESGHELHKHHCFALSVAAFQVGIVLASVSLLVRLKALYAMSLVAGAAGVAGLVVGLLA